MSSEHRLNVVIGEYLRAAEAGQAPDRQELLARHPDLADEVVEFFVDLNRLHGPAGVGSVARFGVIQV